MCMFIAWGEIQEKSFDEQEENNLPSLFCMNSRKPRHCLGDVSTSERAVFWWYGRKELTVRTISAFENKRCYGNSEQ